MTSRTPRCEQVLTYSAITAFQTCRRRFKLRYLDGLVPVERVRPLDFGTVTHEWLKVWHETRSLELTRTVIDQAYLDRAADPDRMADYHYQHAMASAYAEAYPPEAFTVVALEREFSGPLVNPDTGKSSRSFLMRGKADGVIRRDDGEALLEHKTVGTLTGDYIDRLTLDLQIALYCLYLNEELGLSLKSVLYNVLQKPKLIQSRGESEAEFTARAAELAARNKSGKSTAQRREPESDEVFRARLASWYAAEPRFTRLELLLDYDRLRDVRRQIWDVGQEMLYARRKNLWHQNTRACFGFGRCAYWAICSSGSNSAIIENFYRVEGAHPELGPSDFHDESIF